MKLIVCVSLALVASSMPAPAITVTTPANRAKVTSPFTLAASATACAGGPVQFMTYSVDGSGLTIEPSAFSASISQNAGTHVLTVGCYGPKGQDQVSLSIQVGSSSTSAAATPRFSVPSGTYTSKQSVALSNATPGATIYYTTDGSGPTTSSPIYVAAIPVSSSMIIEAIATAPGYAKSGLARASYTIKSRSQPSIPSNAIQVTQIQSLPGWRIQFDTRTNGWASGAMQLVGSPSLSGQAARFNTSFRYYGGVRYSVTYDHDADPKNFVYDAQVRIKAGSTVANLEMDNNQVIANGDTVIYSFQCSGNAGVWEFGSNVGTRNNPIAKWVKSSAPCNPASWTADTWHHVQISYTRDDFGNVTYHSVWLDGEETPIGATVLAAFSLRWPAGSLVANFQVDGNAGTGSSTVYLDQLTLWRW